MPIPQVVLLKEAEGNFQNEELNSFFSSTKFPIPPQTWSIYRCLQYRNSVHYTAIRGLLAASQDTVALRKK